jgi:hypothetical protein
MHDKLHTIPEVDESSESCDHSPVVKYFRSSVSPPLTSGGIKHYSKCQTPMSTYDLWNPGAYSLLDSQQKDSLKLFEDVSLKKYFPAVSPIYTARRMNIYHTEKERPPEEKKPLSSTPKSTSMRDHKPMFTTYTKVCLPRVRVDNRNVSNIARDSFSLHAEYPVVKDATNGTYRLRSTASSDESVLRIFIDPDSKDHLLSVKSPGSYHSADSGIENNHSNSSPNSPSTSADFSPRSDKHLSSFEISDATYKNSSTSASPPPTSVSSCCSSSEQVVNSELLATSRFKAEEEIVKLDKVVSGLTSDKKDTKDNPFTVPIGTFTHNNISKSTKNLNFTTVGDIPASVPFTLPLIKSSSAWHCSPIKQAPTESNNIGVRTNVEHTRGRHPYVTSHIAAADNIKTNVSFYADK